MRVEYEVGMLSHKTKSLHLHVVFPNGVIKDAQVSTDLNSPFFNIEYSHNGEGGRVSGITAVNFKQFYIDAGYTFLKERWAEPGEDPNGYSRYCSWEATARLRSKHPEFPVERLPRSIQAQLEEEVDLDDMLPERPDPTRFRPAAESISEPASQPSTEPYSEDSPPA